MNSIQVSIEANKEEQEILISQLMELDAEGFEQTEKHLLAYFNENVFKGYEVIKLLKGRSFFINTIGERNWNEVWEGNFQPVLVGCFCGIRAEFHEQMKGVEHEIIITPKMSFGTGHHATTHMMIEQMKEIEFKGKKVFDFGTGTGVLAILSEKLGASMVHAIDVDNWSIANANENVERNGCSKIAVELSSQIPHESVHIILANINRNVILNHVAQLESQILQGGHLLLSGLLTSDETDIVQSCHLSLSRRTERNNWISLLFSKCI